MGPTGESSGEGGVIAQNVVRLGWPASILTGLAWFVGYAGFTRVLRPLIGQMGGHVILGFAGLLTLLALAGLFAREATRAVLLGSGGYALAFPGAAVFSAGNLIEGVWLAEFGVRLFALGIMALMAGTLLLCFGMLRERALPPWGVWPLMVGWATFFPMASVPTVFGLAPGATNAHNVGYVAWALSSAALLGAGWVTLGYALSSEKPLPSRRAARER